MVPVITPSAHTALAELVSSLGSDSSQPAGDGDGFSTHCPPAEQLSFSPHTPHTLPHPSSPHSLPSQAGLQTGSSPPSSGASGTSGASGVSGASGAPPFASMKGWIQ